MLAVPILVFKGQSFFRDSHSADVKQEQRRNKIQSIKW